MHRCFASSVLPAHAMGFLVQCNKIGNEKRPRRQLLGPEEPKVSSLKHKSSISSIESNDDMLYEIFRHLDAKSLASASCVSRRWRKAAQDEELWEGICTKNWSTSSARPQQLKPVVLALGGFRRLYVLCLRPLLSRPFSPPGSFALPLRSSTHIDRSHTGRQWSKDEVHLSLSLFSIDCYERLGRRSCISSLDFLCQSSSTQMIAELSSSPKLNNVTPDVR